jgi:H+/Cl- antiporter ClcA
VGKQELQGLWSGYKMTQQDFFTLYIATIGILGGLAGYVITHLLSEIKRLNSRVDEIYNILLDR